MTALLATGACGGSATPEPDQVVPTPFAACASLTATAAPTPAAQGSPGAASARSSEPATPSSAKPGTRAVELPDLALPCMTGDDVVRTGALRGPLVINLWASWCGPCRHELPAFQRLADGGRVPVLGVVTEDDRAKAAWLGDDLKISLPGAYDRTGTLKAALGEMSLPLTVFVAADGSARLYRGPALTDQSLARLVEQHFGRV